MLIHWGRTPSLINIADRAISLAHVHWDKNRPAQKTKRSKGKPRRNKSSDEEDSSDITAPNDVQVHDPSPRLNSAPGSHPPHWHTIALALSLTCVLALCLVPLPNLVYRGIALRYFDAATLRSVLPYPLRRLMPHQTRLPANQVPDYLASYIHKEIRSALKDSVGKRDFALAADGAKIAIKLTSAFESFDARLPDNILDEDLRSASCWSFPGDRGQVGIKVPELIFPTHVTIDHIPREIAADIRQAPRNIIVWGLLEGKGNEQRYMEALEAFQTSPLNAIGDAPPSPITSTSRFVPLVAFDYNIAADFHIQTFSVDTLIVTSGVYFGVFVVEIRSNWGAESTRLYRVRIHGSEVSQ